MPGSLRGQPRPTPSPSWRGSTCRCTRVAGPVAPAVALVATMSARWLCCSQAANSSQGPAQPGPVSTATRSEEHTSELQSQSNLVCRLLLEKKKKRQREHHEESA